MEIRKLGEPQPAQEYTGPERRNLKRDESSERYYMLMVQRALEGVDKLSGEGEKGEQKSSAAFIALTDLVRDLRSEKFANPDIDEKVERLEDLYRTLGQYDDPQEKAEPYPKEKLAPIQEQMKAELVGLLKVFDGIERAKQAEHRKQE